MRPQRLDHDRADRDVGDEIDRKSTRLNSSHQIISYAVFCLKKNKLRHAYARRWLLIEGGAPHVSFDGARSGGDFAEHRTSLRDRTATIGTQRGGSDGTGLPP